MKKHLKYIIVLIIGLYLIPSCVYATNAETLNDLKGELSTLKYKKSTAENKKKKTQNQLKEAKNNVYNAQQEIDKGKNQIEIAKQEIENLTVEIANTKESIKNMMSSYQIASGDNVYLDFVMNAKSYADLVYRYNLIKQIIAYDEKQVIEWQNKVEYNNQLQEDLSKKEVELNNKIDKLQVDIEDFGDQLEEYSEITMDINDEIKSTQELIDYYVGIGCKDNQLLSVCDEISGESKFRKPLKKGTITSYFGYRTHPVTKVVNKFHSGVDIGGNGEGTAIYASANGMVGKIIRKAKCGGNQVYVYHTIKGVKYTSSYLHLLNINVSVGDKVTFNTVIGTVGGGKGTRSWETCSTGAHLHFTIAAGWYGSTYASYSTFLAKTQNPKTILNLPNKGIYWFSR